MPPKQRITTPYTYREDYAKLKEATERAISRVKQQIEEDLKSTGEDQQSRKQTVKALEKQLQKFMSCFTSKCNQMVDYRTDPDPPSNAKREKPEDQALIKYNEAESIILRDAYERCRARKVAPRLMMPNVQPDNLKVEMGDGRQTSVKEFRAQTAAGYARQQMSRVAELDKLENYVVNKSEPIMKEVVKHATTLKSMPMVDWQLQG